MAEAVPSTLTTALDRAAEASIPLDFLDRRERRRETSWAEIQAAARRVAAGLRRCGIEPGDRVGVVYPTGPEFFHALFGALAAGAVPVPLYPPVRMGRVGPYRRRTRRLLERVGARALVADRRTREVLNGSLPEGEMARWVTEGDRRRAALEIRCGVHSLADLGRGGDGRERHDSRPDEIALVQFSSGTTAHPKPVALSHRAILAQVEALNRYWPRSDEVEHAGLSWLPLYHDMGLVGCVFVAVARPGPLTLLPPELFAARPAAWLRAMSASRATISPAPSFAYAHCVEQVRDEELAGVDLSGWRFALCGAETVVPAVLERFAARFAAWGFRRQALTPGYGLAEAALAVTFSPPGRGPVSRRFSRRELRQQRRAVESREGVEIASLGPPLAGFAVEIRGDGQEALAEGEIGRVWVTGPSLMDGYLDDPETNRAVLVDGWLDTGDLGFLVAGELHLVGRAKDLLIVRGRNYAPEELEQAVTRVAGVAPGGAAAVAHLRPGGGRERLLMFVERRRFSAAADQASAAELGEACRRELLAATGLAADQVIVLPPGALPRTSSGKIRRQETLARHLAQERDGK